MLAKIIAAATADKKLAQAARKEENYSRAIELIERAVKILETERPRLDLVEKGVLSEENRALAEALTDVHGSSGGIYRSAGQYEKSIKAYDAGFRIERDERFGFVNSYNLTQRLVARVLFEPKDWVVIGEVIEQERFPTCLVEARDIVVGQTRGPRKEDVWAWADLGMLWLLNGEAADIAWDKVIEYAKQPFVFESTVNVLGDLMRRIAPVAARVDASPRLGDTYRALDEAAALLGESAGMT